MIISLMIGVSLIACDDSTERTMDSNQSTSDTSINSGAMDQGASQGGGGMGTGSGLATDTSSNRTDSSGRNNSTNSNNSNTQSVPSTR